MYAGDFAANSDARLKNIGPTIQNPINKVMALRGVHYTWNAEGRKIGLESTQPQIGVLAQDVEALFPELVSEKDGFKLVSYDRLVPVLIEAFKALNEKVENLEKH